MSSRVVHCSYHKCLTVYYQRIMRRLKFALGGRPRFYRHFDSRLEEFQGAQARFRVASVNNHALVVDELHPDTVVSRFVRDPRDLIVSGYHYHRRGAEAWTEARRPTEADFRVVNGVVPPDIGSSSFAEHLADVDRDQGMAAELTFRGEHFRSMLDWQPDDERVRTWRYEDVIDHEGDVFDEVFRFYGLRSFQRDVGLRLVRRFAASRRNGTTHVRDPRPGQWRTELPPVVHRRFLDQFGQILERYGYPVDPPFSR